LINRLNAEFSFHQTDCTIINRLMSNYYSRSSSKGRILKRTLFFDIKPDKYY